MGTTHGHKCLGGCGKNITWQFAICTECEKKYGKSPKVWPRWLAFLWSDEQRLRRQARAIRAHEITSSDIPGGMEEDFDGEEYNNYLND